MSVPHCRRGQKSGIELSNSHRLSLIYLPKDHLVMRGSLWMLKHSPSLKCLRRFWGICLICFSWNRTEQCWKHQETSGKTWSPETSLLAVFCVVAIQEKIAADWLARLHAVICQNLQTKGVWTRQSLRVAWPFITVATDLFEKVLLWFWNQSVELGARGNLCLARAS